MYTPLSRATSGGAFLSHANIETGMAAPVWSGYLSFGLISIPVKLYPAARSEAISFHMLHRGCGQRVRQQLVCPEHGVLSRTDIVRGFEYEKNRYIEVESEDIKKIEPSTAQAMDILEFVPLSQVDPVYFDSSYYLVPDEPGRRAYVLLHRALAESQMCAIAQVAMHNREYTTIVRPLREGIIVHSMFYANEVRNITELGAVNRMEVNPKELGLAHSLIEGLRGDFDKKKYKDNFQENLARMLGAKLEGHPVEEIEKPKLAPVIDLMAALKKSLEEVRSVPRKQPGAAAARQPTPIRAVARETAAEPKAAGRPRRKARSRS